MVSSSAKSQLQKGGSLKRKSISFEDTNPTASPNKAIKKANTPYQSKKRPFGNGKVYAPPQGKYSAKLDRIGKLQTLYNKHYKILEWSRQKKKDNIWIEIIDRALIEKKKAAAMGPKIKHPVEWSRQKRKHMGTNSELIDK